MLLKFLDGAAKCGLWTCCNHSGKHAQAEGLFPSPAAGTAENNSQAWRPVKKFRQEIKNARMKNGIITFDLQRFLEETLVRRPPQASTPERCSILKKVNPPAGLSEK